MLKRNFVCVPLFLAVFGIACACAAETAVAPQEVFADGTRVVVLGDSITYAGGYIDLIETFLLTRYPERTVEIINLGLPSETANGLTEPDHPFPRPNVHERLDRALARAEPDVVIADYGMNDGIYHPFSLERAAAYQGGIDRLIAKVDAAGARLILMTPPPFEAASAGNSLVDASAPEFGYKTPYRDYDEVIVGFGRWLIDERAGRVERVVDLHGPLAEFQAAQHGDGSDSMTVDGVHPSATGHWLIARAVLAALVDGGPQELHTAAWPSDAGQLDIRWTCRVPAPVRPVVAVASLGGAEQANGEILAASDRHMLVVTDAPVGTYGVYEGTESLGTFTATELAAGIDVRQLTGASINESAGELASLVVERQRLLRNAWLTHVGHTRPGTPAGMPLEAAQAKAEQLTAQIDRLRQRQRLRLRIVRK
ncbi:MAG: SGNH/GDSL hydrolase family protein [Planctomycetales bacterium]|nr:SGNH/GDSL hydrolase family protein [Planctomycetales bacterium]